VLNLIRGFFIKDYFDSSSPEYTRGDIPANNTWDGVTCIDGREKLMLSNAQTYGWVPMRVQESKVDNYTLEMWLKPS